MTEWHEFYFHYDPTFDWWIKAEWDLFLEELRRLVPVIREHLVGISPGDEDAIVGQPSGRESILKDLQGEVVPYSPEELILLGQTEYEWCEVEMIKASRELG